MKVRLGSENGEDEDGCAKLSSMEERRDEGCGGWCVFDDLHVRRVVSRRLVWLMVVEKRTLTLCDGGEMLVMRRRTRRWRSWWLRTLARRRRKVAAVLVEAPWWSVDAPARKEGDDVLTVATTCGIGGSGGSGTAVAARQCPTNATTKSTKRKHHHKAPTSTPTENTPKPDRSTTPSYTGTLTTPLTHKNN
ncbi:uncharacterized protein HKW66_Vig0008660 [Vigna angularis]|uniref:Uncharacterized protein n=1 Tax=Phaseolus angularis TaxID=3914 RepID=A0A8T0LFG7_PHAAN|nr:uncharacterized protein HKW66_Vig0008660 [Vigna angularis]